MQSTRVLVFNSIPDILDALSTTVDMIAALGGMIEYTMDSGDDLKSICYGVERIVNQQCEDIRFMEQALRDQFQELKLEKLAVPDPQVIASMTGLPADRVKQVIGIAAGIHF